MKRNLKPFAVEIKKSRVQGQGHRLPPRRLFEILPSETTKIVQKEEPQVTATPAVPRRILPSLVEPVYSNSDAVEPVRRKRTLGSKVKPQQIELDLSEIASNGLEDEPVEASVTASATAQTDVAPVHKERTTLDDEHEPKAPEGATTKSRKTRNNSPEAVEPTLAFEAAAEAEQAPGKMVVTPSRVETSTWTNHQRLAKRQAAAAELPRHERWKRRLHPASW